MSKEEDDALGNVFPKVLGFVENYKAEKSAGTAGWIAGLVALVLALVAVAVLAYRQWKTGKKIAELLHKEAVAEEDQHQAKLDRLVADSEERVEEALERYGKLLDKSDSIARELDELQVKNEVIKESINKVTSWEDLDDFIEK